MGGNICCAKAIKLVICVKPTQNLKFCLMHFFKGTALLLILFFTKLAKKGTFMCRPSRLGVT